MSRAWICLRRLALLAGVVLVSGVVASGQEQGAGSLPEVVRVRVPSARVPTYFAEGTALRGMPVEEFESLWKSARAAVAAPVARTGRLIRATHRIRWESGSLLGRTELIVEGGAADELIALDPWNAWVDAEHSSATVGTQEDGRPAIRAEGGDRVEIAWRLSAGEGSGGRVFEVALPVSEIATVELEIPATMSAEGLPGLVERPEASAGSAYRRWRSNGRGGRFTLTLRDEAEGGAAEASQVWLGGPIRVEIGDAEANWEADWTIELGPRAPRELDIELDPRLELVGVTGPDLSGFETIRDLPGGPLRLRVRLAGGVRGSTRLLIEALARVPGTGVWEIPYARPLTAVWTGGRTSVGIGPARVLTNVRPLAGRAVASRAEERDLASGVGRLVVFESLQPTPAAELTFTAPELEAAAEIRGVLRIGDDAPSLRARVSWSFQRGPVLDLPIDLPPGWLPQTVDIEGLTEPTAWRQEWRGDGGARVVVQPPSYLDLGARVVVRLSAISTGGRTSRVAAPRVRAVGARLLDDLWLAVGDGGTAVEPIEAQGLSWIDPAVLREMQPESSPAVDSLAWRWVEPEGEAVFAPTRPPRPLIGETWVVGQIGSDGLTVDWYIAIEPVDRRTGEVTLRANESDLEPPEVSLLGGEIGPALEVRTAPAEAARGGSAWTVALPAGLPSDRRLMLHARLERPWSGSGTLPLVSLAARSHAAGTALVWVDPDRQVDAVSAGVRSTDRIASDRAFRELYRRALQVEAPLPSGRRLARAFAFGPAPGPLELRTGVLEDAGSAGVVLEARLSVRLGSGGRALQRLALQILPGMVRGLEVELPAGTRLERCLVDGRAVIPLRVDSGVIVPLGGPKVGKPALEVVLDYATEPAEPGAGLPRSIRWPGISMPCLASTCEFEVPDSFEIVGARPGLTRTGLNPPRFPSATAEIATFTRLARRSDEGLGQAIHDLEKALDSRGAAASTLGDWLTRLDAGARMLVVDRLGLASAGLGPRSRPPALASESGGAGSLARTLRALDLRVVPFGSIVLVTTASGLSEVDRRDRSEDWTRLLNEVITRECDATDRYQTVARWRGEPTPEAAIETRTPGSAPGAAISRWVRIGSPTSPVTYLVRRGSTEWLWGAAAALLVVLIGVLGRKTPWVVRGGMAGVLIGAGLFGSQHGGSMLRGLSLGLVLGTIGALAYWLGAGRVRPRASGDSVSTTSVALTALILLIGVSPLVRPLTAASRDGEEPIVVLLPYEDGVDPLSPAERVVLRLVDFERLTNLASRTPSPHRTARLTTTARHLLRRVGAGGEALVESAYEVESDDEATRDWVFPLGEGRETTCELDGEAATVRVIEDGQKAAISIAGAGVHQLKIRRRLAIDATGELRLPVLPVATSLVFVEGGGTGAEVAIRTASGTQEARKGVVEGQLGPSPWLVVDWTPDPPGSARFQSVEGLLLWDLEPAGDRLRARLTVRGDGRASRLRLALDPGWMVRSAGRPGWTETSWEGTAARPVWVARMDPPPADGEVISLELWRPRAEGSGGLVERRTAPRVVPLDVESWSGLVAARVAPLWEGRFEPEPSDQPALEDLFLRSWGPLLEPTPGVRGTFNWREAADVSASLRFTETPPVVRASTQVEIGLGRLDVRVEARCAGLGEVAPVIEVGVPEGLEVVRVEATGLSGWERTGPDRLRIRLGESATPERSLTIQGWIGLPGDPLAVATSAREHPLPRVTWPGARVEPGSITVFAPPATPFRVEDRRELATVRTPAPDETGAIRASYRATGPEPAATLRWLAEPPRTNVSLWSHLTVDPESVEWTTRVRCQVVRGPFRELRLEMPPEWADRVRVESEGGTVASSVVREGNKSILEIRPDRPIWGTRDLLILGTRPIEGQTVAFPNLVPLGNGQVTSYVLAWADRSGRSPVAEGSAGLQQIDASRFDLTGLPVPTLAERKVYQVLLGNWSLRLRLAAEAGGESRDARSRAASWTDTECVVDESGQVVGITRVGLAAGHSPFLVVSLPGGLSLGAATVDGMSVRPLQGPDRTLAVALGDARDSVVALVWSGRVDGSSLELPAPASQVGESLLTLYAPAGWTAEPASGRLVATSLESLETQRLERIAGRLVEDAMRLDRSSTRDRAGLVGLLSQFEVRRRAAWRMLTWNGPGVRRLGTTLRQGLVDRLRRAAESLDVALRDAGLSELQEGARSQAGGEPDQTPGKSIDLTLLGEPLPDVRLRRLGMPWAFQGASPSGGSGPAVRWSRASAPDEAQGWPLLITSSACALAVLLGLVLPRLGSRRRFAMGIASGLLILLGLALGILLPGLGAAGVMLAFGRAERRVRTDSP